MMMRKIFVSACAAAMFATVNVGPAMAQGQPLDQRTEFTFNAPVELPGVTLPPGTYVFRFVDPNTQKKVMQVMTKDDQKTYGMFLVINAEREKPSEEAELRFMETPAGKPAAVKTWWYPGTTIGREFIYPKSQARRLAMATNTTVLTTKADSETVPTTEVASADLEYVAPNGQESAVAQSNSASAASAAATPNTAAAAPDNTFSNAPVQESTSASSMNNASSRRSLPRTNTMLPLLALMGLSSLAGGASLRFRR
jgi:hypothetical protein